MEDKTLKVTNHYDPSEPTSKAELRARNECERDGKREQRRQRQASLVELHEDIMNDSGFDGLFL